MATFKGDVSTISLKKEDNATSAWGNKPVAWTGAKIFQNNDGSFNAERGSIESEARNPTGGLSGFRLGQTNVAGSFPVEIDPTNYNQILESALYGTFAATGAVATTAGSAGYVSSTEYALNLTVAAGVISTLVPKLGAAYRVQIPADGSVFDDICILKGTGATSLEFLSPNATGSITASTSVIVITPIKSLVPASTRTSFNAEETLTSADGKFARFMTKGAVCSGLELDLPSEGKVLSTFSFVGSGKKASTEYASLGFGLSNLTADSANGAHSNPVAHTASQPLVLQDGVIISTTSDVRCAWLSGSVTIENGTEPSFVGCSFDAKVMSSGKFVVNVSYEALFESEAAYVAFNNEVESELLLQLKTPSGQTLGLYLPRFKASSYSMNNSTGLVTASISGSAIIDTDMGTQLSIFSTEA